MHEDDGLVATWARGGLAYPPCCEHTRLEIVEAFWREKTGKDPLKDGEPVPRCTCALCVGEKAVRAPVRPSEWFNDALERARGRSILNVVQMLGLGEPIMRGRECRVRCPLHDDERPSLTISLDRNVWYCFPCGIGGDGIKLYRLATGLSFGDVVRELAA